MKTVSEIAREFGVTPTTIYRKLDKAVQQGIEQGLTEKRDNITYITERGEEFLDTCLTRAKQGSTNVEPQLNSVEQPLNPDKPP